MNTVEQVNDRVFQLEERIITLETQTPKVEVESHFHRIIHSLDSSMRSLEKSGLPWCGIEPQYQAYLGLLDQYLTLMEKHESFRSRELYNLDGAFPLSSATSQTKARETGKPVAEHYIPLACESLQRQSDHSKC